MQYRRVSLAGASALALVSCGGGGGNGGGNPPPTGGPTPPPTLNVTLSEASADVVLDEGGEATFGFDASYTGTSSQAIIADVEIGGRRYQLDGDVTGSGSTFTVNLKTVPFPAGGATTSTVRFRLCTTAACSTVYPGSTQTFTVNLDVEVGDWAGFQRNAAHTGYVPVRLAPADFALAWEWTDTDLTSWIRPPAASRGRIITTVGRDGGMPYFQNAKVYAFNTDGSNAWSFDLGEQSNMSGPSLSNGMVHVTSMEFSSRDNPQWVFDAANGSFVNQMKFASQWHDFNQPAAMGDQVFVAAGYTGGVLFSYDAVQGTKLWEVPVADSSWADGKAVAVDGDTVLYPASSALVVIDRATGQEQGRIIDPDVEARFVSSFESAPVIGNDGMVFLFSGEKRFNSSAKIMGVSLTENRIVWKSVAEYTTAFAVAGDTIYAVRNDAHVLAALDAKTGQQKWATQLPVDTGLYGERIFQGNVVVTENLVFVSDHDTTWAVDLKDDAHPIVWEAPTGGRLIITPDNQLVTTGVREFRKLTVYDLF
ncbi:PQQ-binding-like beta-propeller repeat protein [Erythrobacter sp. THAF29]|uniref:outer membrane protein assembly factor BamB family protein n=1 Tax=Erythrobacter sp. THAF29 TaxID=2587851 RepID=UPI0012A8DBFE|nr:PQQ-binding-like beta-propeller repeat protein [Erythrobacter sp. THAF29]QFT78227.1 outer membrane biogenesis protein BamB [Erythrobacter sp. THAF29]